MMSPLLRAEMILIAVLFTGVVVYYVNQKRVRLAYMLLWLLIAVGLLIAAIFPGVVAWLCRITGIQTPVNLLYLLGILLLLLISFRQTITLSRQADALTRLTQIVSLEKSHREQKEAHDDR